MARHTGVHKATCQRLVEGLAPALDGAEALLRLPGVEGLRGFLNACRRKGVPKDRLEAAAAATDELAATLARMGLSQRALMRRVVALTAPGPGAQRRAASESTTPRAAKAEGSVAGRAHRRGLFDAARNLTGEELFGKSVVVFLRPSASDPALLDETIVSTLVGCRREAFSRPIVVIGLGNIGLDTPGATLLAPFCTAGVRAVPLAADNARTILVADLAETAPGAFGPGDICALFRTVARNPLEDPAARLNVAARIAQPCRHLVLDVYLHRTLAPRLRAVTGAYALSAVPGELPFGSPADVWFERFPHVARPTRLRAGTAPADAPRASPRQAEITRHAAAMEGLNLRDFTLYRVEADYPVWQSDYRVYLEPAGATLNGRRTGKS